MGADFTEQRAEGKTAAEAYARALADAAGYYGTRDGYSGAINSKDRGFITVELPPRMTYAKLQALLEDYDMASGAVWEYRERVKSYRPGGFFHGKRGWKGNLKKAEVKLRKAQRELAKVEKRVPPSMYDFASLVEAYHDKWGQPLAVQLSTREAKPTKRGRRVWVFFGYAPC